MTETTQRLAEIVNQVRELNLSKEDKNSGNAILLCTLIDGDLRTQIDGVASDIGDMLFNTAEKYPAFGDILKQVSAALN